MFGGGKEHRGCQTSCARVGGIFPRLNKLQARTTAELVGWLGCGYREAVSGASVIVIKKERPRKIGALIFSYPREEPQASVASAKYMQHHNEKTCNPRFARLPARAIYGLASRGGMGLFVDTHDSLWKLFLEFDISHLRTLSASNTHFAQRLARP